MKASPKHIASMGALVTGATVFGAGCTAEDLNLILTLAKIIALFV